MIEAYSLEIVESPHEIGDSFLVEEVGFLLQSVMVDFFLQYYSMFLLWLL